MKHGNQDLMNEGWNAMQVLLNEEMPTKTKNNNYLLIGLMVLFAFGGGIFVGTQLGSGIGNATAENHHSKYSKIQDLAFLNVSVAENKPIQKLISNIFNRKSSAAAANDNVTGSVNNRLVTKAEPTSPFKEKISKQTLIINDLPSTVGSQTSATIKHDGIKSFEQASILTQDLVASEAIAVSYLPRSNSKYKKPTNWVLALGLSSGINPGRDTKVASLKSEWLYKVGKQNAIGVEFIYSAEDKFGFLNFGETPVAEVSRERPGKETQGRENVESLIQNSRQFRYAAGLVYQQEIGYRFYSNFGAGLNLMQNSYSNELVYKSLNTIDNIKYHWGGYTSIAFGYRISKLVDFEVSGTKSLFVQENLGYLRGSTDQIVGGLKISF